MQKGSQWLNFSDPRSARPLELTRVQRLTPLFVAPMGGRFTLF